MFKVADLDITTEKSDEDIYRVRIAPGPRDLVITFGTCLLLTCFIWFSFLPSPLLCVFLQFMTLWYTFEIIEDSVTLMMDSKQERVRVEKRKFGRLMRVYESTLDDVHGVVLCDKDLSMGGQMAKRLEVVTEQGFVVPLSRAWVVDLALINRMQTVSEEIQSFLETKRKLARVTLH